MASLSFYHIIKIVPMKFQIGTFLRASSNPSCLPNFDIRLKWHVILKTTRHFEVDSRFSLELNYVVVVSIRFRKQSMKEAEKEVLQFKKQICVILESLK